MKIISGGQIGVDLGALYGAKECGIETGGTAPYGWISGGKPNKELLQSFGLIEGPYDDKIYPKRTMKNVDDSDGTICILRSHIYSRGTMMTIGYCQTGKWQYKRDGFSGFYKPYVEITSTYILIAACIARLFIEENNLQIINFAGHRESSCNGIQEFTRQLIKKIKYVQ